MDLMRQLNREQGTTFIVVTHNPAVARAADRIITLRDGRVLRDERLESVYLSDLREFKESALGQAILRGNVPPELRTTGFDSLAERIRGVLEKI
jgi:ABC-type glutathione transport system ATPase component